MRVLVCGSRDWIDEDAIRREMVKLPPNSVVIEGGARGADTIAGKLAKELKLELEVYMAQWEKYGRAAGPVRNRQMLVEGVPDLVLAFYDPKTSIGTKNMVKQARKAGVPVKEFFK